MKRPPTSLRLIVIEALVLVGLQLVLTHLLARARLLEHLLAPGGGSYGALAVTATFLLLRFGVIVLLPGWFLARLWLWATDCRSGGAQVLRSSVRTEAGFAAEDTNGESPTSD